jgi:hypothetical protein
MLVFLFCMILFIYSRKTANTLFQTSTSKSKNGNCSFFFLWGVLLERRKMEIVIYQNYNICFTVCSCKDRYDHSIGTVDSFVEIA